MSSKREFKSLDEALAAMPTDVLDKEIARLQAEQIAANEKAAAAAKKPN
jgi:hypothetical protein